MFTNNLPRADVEALRATLVRPSRRGNNFAIVKLSDLVAKGWTARHHVPAAANGEVDDAVYKASVNVIDAVANIRRINRSLPALGSADPVQVDQLRRTITLLRDEAEALVAAFPKEAP